MRDKKELEKLYKDCMEYWGFEKQARMTQEECAELIGAISHHLRGRKNATADLVEELADVYLMLNQLISYFGEDVVMDVVDRKSDGVKGKLEKYKNGKDISVKNDKIDATNYEDRVYCISCGATYATSHKSGCRFYAQYHEFEIR